MIETILIWVENEPDVWVVIDELSHSFDLWLISDQPQDRLARIPDYAHIERYFKNQILFIPELGLAPLLPDLFYLASQQCNHPLSSCLLVTSDQRTATIAVNHGLNAIIFVDAFRLRREFNLRGLLP